MDPWAMALGALFRGPGSAAATYLSPDGEEVAVRVIRSRGTKAFGDGELLADVDVVEIRRSELAEPQEGGMLTLAGTPPEVLTLQGGARLDVEGLTWTIGVEPAEDL